MVKSKNGIRIGLKCPKKISLFIVSSIFFFKSSIVSARLIILLKIFNLIPLIASKWVELLLSIEIIELKIAFLYSLLFVASIAFLNQYDDSSERPLKILFSFSSKTESKVLSNFSSEERFKGSEL
ncbi:hypothetical protein NW062_03190 [Mycoplasmopsis cynos]|nr:hypothetical protein NW062_03190 [Mycoplasmopsis cynos]